MVSFFSSISSSLLFRHLWTVPRISNITGITVTFTFHNFFQLFSKIKLFAYQSTSIWVSFRFLLFSLSISLGRQNLQNDNSFSSCHIFWSRFGNPREFYADSYLDIYQFVRLQVASLLHNSQWIIFLTQSCLLLYSFCTSFPHSFMWLNV